MAFQKKAVRFLLAGGSHISDVWCLVANLDAGYGGTEFWLRGNKTDKAEGRNKVSHLSVP